MHAVSTNQIADILNFNVTAFSRQLFYQKKSIIDVSQISKSTSELRMKMMDQNYKSKRN